MKKFLLISIIFCCYSLIIQAQTTQLFLGWQYSIPVNTENSFSTDKTGYAIRVFVNTETPISAMKMDANGNDIRFTDSCGSKLYPHWVQYGLNTDSTAIWVLVDEFQAGVNKTVYMIYGNDTAANSSDFNLVFPNAYISNGNDTLSGTLNIDWFEVQAGDTIYLSAGSGLFASGIYSLIEGEIYGAGMGYAGGVLSGIGSGPGGGGTSSNSGAGGGGYGGAGGTGGYDAGDTPGTGGSTYGDSNSMTIEMGSGGGATDASTGGNGGGAVSLIYTYVTVYGYINVNGSNGSGGNGRNGGGGSGGGILIAGADVLFSGVLSAEGGSGGIGTSSANDDGGGGGGGRIKILYTNYGSATGLTTVMRGQGGTYGTTLPTEGTDGTYYEGIAALEFAHVASVSPEETFIPGMNIEILSTPPYIYTTFPATAYQWYMNGSAISGAVNDSLLIDSSASYSVTVMTPGNCLFESEAISLVEGIEETDNLSVQIFPNPATDVCTVQFDSKKNNFSQMILSDPDGRVLWSLELTDLNGLTTIDIPVKSLQPGVYFISLSGNSFTSATFIKQ